MGLVHGVACPGVAWPGSARHGRAWQGTHRKPETTSVGLGLARRGAAGLGAAWPGMAGNPSQAGDDFGGIGIVCNK